MIFLFCLASSFSLSRLSEFLKYSWILTVRVILIILFWRLLFLTAVSPFYLLQLFLSYLQFTIA